MPKYFKSILHKIDHTEGKLDCIRSLTWLVVTDIIVKGLKYFSGKFMFQNNISTNF